MSANPLPPLQSLVFFETAARHLNFTAAAQELSATQPAVSQRIGALEAELGVALFRRTHRGVALTADGAHLFEAVRTGLAGIAEAVARLRDRRAGQGLTVGTDFGLAAYWLMPRMAVLRAAWPELDVRIVTAQHEVDVRADGVDMAIAFGDGHWAGCEAEALFPEVVVPVCSPAFAQRHPELRSGPTALLTVPLLHLESPRSAQWADWRDWFAGQQLKLSQRSLRSGLTLNNHTLVLQAAITGQGVALGWRPLVDELLRSGQLVLACDRSLTREDRGYWLVQPSLQRPGPALRRFKDWLLRGELAPAGG